MSKAARTAAAKSSSSQPPSASQQNSLISATAASLISAPHQQSAATYLSSSALLPYTNSLANAASFPPVVVLESGDHVCYALPRTLALRMLSVGTRLANGEGVIEECEEDADIKRRDSENGIVEIDEAGVPTTDTNKDTRISPFSFGAQQSMSSAEYAAASASASASGVDPFPPLRATRLHYPDISSAAMRRVVEYVIWEWRESDVASSLVAAARPGQFKAENQALQAAREAEAEREFYRAAQLERDDPELAIRSLEALATTDGVCVELLPRPAESMFTFLRSASSNVLCELASASFYLDVKPLVEATCRAIAGLIRGKSAEEIRETFSITNDFSPAEEEAVGRSIVERAMLLPPHVIEEQGPGVLLSTSPLPPPPRAAILPARESKRAKLKQKLKQRASMNTQSAAIPEEAQSVDELMEFIEDDGEKRSKHTSNTKTKAKKTRADSMEDDSKQAEANPVVAESNAAQMSTKQLTDTLAKAMADYDSRISPVSTLPVATAASLSSTASASKPKKKKKKNKSSASLNSSTDATADEPDFPDSVTFKHYSSSALSALMNDPDALAGLLAKNSSTAIAGGDTDASRSSSSSFNDSLTALVQSLHSLDVRTGMRTADLELDMLEAGENAISSDEVQKFQHLLASASATTTSSAQTMAKSLPQNVTENIDTFIAGGGSNSASSGTMNNSAESQMIGVGSSSPSLTDEPSLFLHDAQLSQLIDAKLSGLANWEAQHTRRDSESSMNVPPISSSSSTASPTIEFNLNSDSLDSFASYMCSCPKPSITASSSATESAGISPMTLCPQCGLFQLKNGANLLKSVSSASTATAKQISPSTSSSSLAPSSAAPVPAASLPSAVKSELTAFGHRLAGIDNHCKQSSKALTERMKALEKVEAQVKTMQTTFSKQITEERSARTKAIEERIKVEETLRRESEQRLTEFDSSLDTMRTLIADSSSSASVINDMKSKVQKCSDKIATIEKSLNTSIQASHAAMKEDMEKEIKRAVSKVDKNISTLSTTLTKEITTSKDENEKRLTARIEKLVTAAVAKESQERDEVNVALIEKVKKLEETISNMELARVEQQMNQAAMIEAAVANAMSKFVQNLQQQQQQQHHQHSSPPSNGLSSHYSPLLSRPSSLVPSSLSSDHSSLHSVFAPSSNPSSLGGSNAWSQPSSLASSQPSLNESDLYPFDSSASVAASLLVDDPPLNSSVNSSQMWGSFPPVPISKLNTPSNPSTQHGLHHNIPPQQPYSMQQRLIQQPYSMQQRLGGGILDDQR